MIDRYGAVFAFFSAILILREPNNQSGNDEKYKQKSKHIYLNIFPKRL
jgi:hypothetical protein